MSTPSDLNTYLNSIGRLPVLTREAQLLHCRRIHEWVNWPGGRDAAPTRVRRLGERSMSTMVITNTRLVVSIARKYNNRGLDLADLIQEGNMGLIRGLELYDPTRGYALSTYAYWWIRQSITRALHVHARTIRIPINAHETLSKAHKLINQFTTAHGRPPTTPELAAALDVSPERIHQLLELSSLTHCVSLDAPSTEEGHTIVTLIPNPEPSSSNDPDVALLQGADRQLLEGGLRALNAMERHVVEENCLNGRSLRDLGADLEINRSKVQTVRTQALRKLRLYLACHGYEQG